MIREALSSEIESISKIEISSFATPWGKSLFLSALNSREKKIFVDEEDNAVAGFIVVETVLDEAHITDLAVADGYRRKGIAGNLVKKVLDFARGLKVKSVFLEVRERNEAAINLYRKFGFTEIARRKGYYSRANEDALILKLSLIYM